MRSQASAAKACVSTPERAILELLDEVPKRETFHQADVLMEGLRNLSPRRLRFDVKLTGFEDTSWMGLLSGYAAIDCLL